MAPFLAAGRYFSRFALGFSFRRGGEKEGRGKGKRGKRGGQILRIEWRLR